MNWINFLHFYQPAHTDARVIEEAASKSYRRVVGALKENPQIKFTFNISGCLLLRWEELRYFDLIEDVKKLLEKGQIEMVGTAAYHPIIPLIPKKEVIWQIKENEKILKKYFGESFKPQGFFFPEMAFSPESAKIVRSLGYKWTIIDEIAYNGKINQVDFNYVYQDEDSKLNLVFRDRNRSKSYVPHLIGELLEKIEEDRPIITATDGELYGLRHEDPEGEFEQLLKNDQLKTILVSDFVKKTKEPKKIKTISCSWESSEEELSQNKPYALWFDKNNKIQQKIWDLSNIAYNLIENHTWDKYYHWARWHFVRGLSSCTFWWASAKDFRLFGPISWSPDEIERGINEFIRAIRALDDEKTRETKVKSEKLYLKIKQLVWERHWRYYWKK